MSFKENWDAPPPPKQNMILISVKRAGLVVSVWFAIGVLAGYSFFAP